MRLVYPWILLVVALTALSLPDRTYSSNFLILAFCGIVPTLGPLTYRTIYATLRP